MRSSSLFLSSSNLASFVLGGSVSAGVGGVGGFARACHQLALDPTMGMDSSLILLLA